MLLGATEVSKRRRLVHTSSELFEQSDTSVLRHAIWVAILEQADGANAL